MNIQQKKLAWISDKQRKAMLELILIRYRKQSSFTAQMEKKIEQFENQIFLKIHKAEAQSGKVKFNHYLTTCLKSVEKMFKEKLEDLSREYNAMLNSVAKTTVATGKRPFGLIQDPTMVSSHSRTQVLKYNMHFFICSSALTHKRKYSQIAIITTQQTPFVGLIFSSLFH